MPNAAAIALLAERLPAGLVHPGDGDQQPAKVIPLMGLSNLGISDAQAAHFAKESGMPANDAPKLIAEAIVALLEGDGGLELVPRAEIERLRAEAAGLDDLNPSAPMVTVRCHCNREPILSLAVGRAQVVTDGKTLRARLDQVCGCV